MLAQLSSVGIAGIDAQLVTVEVDLTRGLPGLIMVGLADKAVQESRDRVRSAVLNSGYQFPARKIVINLAPAELRKEGGLYDLPIALGILAADEQIEEDALSSYLVLGELGLDGTLRPIKGALAAAITAHEAGCRGILLPHTNMREALVVAEAVKTPFEVLGVRTLAEAVGVITGRGTAAAPPPPKEDAGNESPLDFRDVRGHDTLKRAITVAAAGGHNLSVAGPPGSGKTMCAKRIPTILPPLTFEESMETTKVMSIAGELRPGQGLVTLRPFRSPHHSISAPGLVGGGTHPRPGEISLAHNGVLFLDEAPEFNRNILETLRQPLEDGTITISRAAGTITYPARLMLVLSHNLCPCGRRGDGKKQCLCSPKQVAQYLTRLSGPLMDRVDLQVEVSALGYDELRAPPGKETSASMREQVLHARERQRERFPDRPSPVNAGMSEKELQTHCRLNRDSESILKTAVEEFGFSARGYARILKVARTVADIGGEETIQPNHLTEAIGYRRLDQASGY